MASQQQSSGQPAGAGPGQEPQHLNVDLEASSSSGSSASTSQQQPSIQKPAAKSNFAAPKIWMMVFGVLLAVCAGAVNVVTARSLSVFVSHVTGTLAKVGMRLEGVTTGANEPGDWLHSVLLLASFIFGSFLCGLVIPKNQVHFGGKSFYGVALLGNSFLLIAAAFVAPSHLHDVLSVRAVAAGCLAAMACGLQNAMCSMHFGAIVRTTHVTGTATDIGSTAGRATMILLRNGCRLRKADDFDRMELNDDIRKLCVLLSVFTGFLCGSFLGAFLESALGIHALFVPAMVTGTTGLLYTFFRTSMKKQLKKLEERQLADELGEMESALQRVRSRLESASPGRERESLEEMGELFCRSLREFEAAVAELHSEHTSVPVLRARTL